MHVVSADIAGKAFSCGCRITVKVFFWFIFKLLKRFQAVLLVYHSCDAGNNENKQTNQKNLYWVQMRKYPALIFFFFLFASKQVFL